LTIGPRLESGQKSIRNGALASKNGKGVCLAWERCLLAAECGVRPAQTRVIMWGRSKDKTNQSYAPSIPLTSSSSTPDNGNRHGRACEAVRVVVLRLQRACVRAWLPSKSQRGRVGVGVRYSRDTGNERARQHAHRRHRGRGEHSSWEMEKGVMR
jgi:hypothetical protein